MRDLAPGAAEERFYGQKTRGFATPAGNEPAVSLAERQQQIAQRAYELHAARGYRPGHDLEDWLDAERELSAAA